MDRKRRRDSLFSREEAIAMCNGLKKVIKKHKAV
jgi:hypothetical protein